MESKVNNGQELGANLIKICKKLLANQDLCKLLINQDLDPINKALHPDIENTMELFGKNIRVIPLVSDDEQLDTSKVVLVFNGSEITDNLDNERISLLAYVYCPFDKWKITGEQLRPFAIMSEIRKSLSGRKINGLGEISYMGFDITTLTHEMGSYVLKFSIGTFN